MTRPLRALRDNGATFSMATVTSILMLFCRAVTAMLSLETKLMAVSWACVCMYPLQSILVGLRRRSRHWRVDKAAMVAYYSPPILAFYVANAVYTSQVDESTPFLKNLALTMLCCTLSLSSRFGWRLTNMRAYSLRDGPRDRWRFVQWVVFLGCVEWKWSWTWRADQGLMKLVDNMFPHVALPFFILFANRPKSTLDYETKAVADYMRSTLPFPDDIDANNLQLGCCKYPFVQNQNGEWISIKDLLIQHRDLSVVDQDICLSYSLSRLLARRYYGFYCAEEGDVKVRRFALANLGRGAGYERAFKIVEVQLAFLQDYFFTVSLPITKSKTGMMAPGEDEKYEPIIFLLLGILLLLMATIRNPAPHWYQDQIREAPLVILGTLIVYYLILLPVHILLPNYWYPIQISFGRVNPLPAPNTNIFQWFGEHVFPPPNNGETQTGRVYWSDKIGQYSILHDYNRCCSRTKALVAWFEGHVLCQPSYSFINHLPEEAEDVDVPNIVREVVAKTLWDIDGLPTNGTNGTKSLEINRERIMPMYDWSWTCREKTHTATILIWHIATCYCDMSVRHSGRSERFPQLVETETSNNNYKIATTLSKYCAYLVAFLPEFLPEHSLTTKEVFQNVIRDAKGALGTMHQMNENEKHTRMRDLHLPPWSEQTTFQKGVRLGRQLDMLVDIRLQWKVMADFWVETILYIAPSDNVEAHIEHLAKGGQFVTHLWAMLSNAGIFKRGEA